MSLGSTVSDSSSRTWVDSADSGSHEEASLFWTEVSLAEKVAMIAGEHQDRHEDDPLGHAAGQGPSDLSVHAVQWTSPGPFRASVIALRSRPGRVPAPPGQRVWSWNGARASIVPRRGATAYSIEPSTPSRTTAHRSAW